MSAHALSSAPSAPGGWPLIGHLVPFARDPLGFLSSLRDLGAGRGDLVRWRFGPRRAVFVADPAEVRKVLLGQEDSYRVGGEAGYAFALFAGEGIINTSGPRWRRQRKMMQPGMRPKRIAGYALTMTALAEEMVEGWRAGEQRDIRREMLHLTQRIAAKTLFGADVAGDAPEVGAAFDVASREIGAEFRGVTTFLPPWVPTPGRVRMRRAIASIEDVLYRIVAERRALDAERPDEHDDLLSMLMSARDEDGAQMSDRQLRDEVMTLYIAGHETTGNTLTWAYLLLSRHPEIARRLETEVDAVLGDRSPSMSDYHRMTYTEAVVKETLRLYPPAWLLPSTTIREVELAGYVVPAETEVWLSQWPVQRDPRWFDKPDRFRPERFLGDAARTIPPYAWFPFGGGPHMCLGSRFALVEATLILAVVARRFSLDVDPDIPAEPEPLVTLQPRTAVLARLRDRVPRVADLVQGGPEGR